jgi:ParB family transcriptional regulator, chromosome partitioning protein
VSTKRALGRGLGALLGQERPASDVVTNVRIDAIRPNPRQPRTNFEPESLAELERSIRELGVLVPIVVRPLATPPDTYELVAGERRWRAAAAAGLATLPALVRNLDDRGSLEVAIVENLQREGLDPLEEAMGFQHLIDEFGFTQERVAERVGRSRPAVANALRLLGLSDDLKARLRRGALSVGHARALLGLEPSIREAVARQVERDDLTVRDVERMGTRRNERSAPARAPAAAKLPALESVESRLRYRFGAPVAIVGSPSGAGRIEIRYADAGDLTRVVDLLLPEET